MSQAFFFSDVCKRNSTTRTPDWQRERPPPSRHVRLATVQGCEGLGDGWQLRGVQDPCDARAKRRRIKRLCDGWLELTSFRCDGRDEESAKKARVWVFDLGQTLSSQPGPWRCPPGAPVPATENAPSGSSSQAHSSYSSSHRCSWGHNPGRRGPGGSTHSSGHLLCQCAACHASP